jgi:hypothetical protein
MPLRNSCVPKYLLIDSATLANIFSDKGSKGNLIQDLKNNRNIIWNSYFNMNKSIFKLKDYNFNYTLITDGIGCSLHFKHKNYKESKKKKMEYLMIYLKKVILRLDRFGHNQKT